MAMTGASASPSSISTSSDDAPQLSFDCIWDDEGNYVRLPKRSQEEQEQTGNDTVADNATGTPQNNAVSRPNDMLCNEQTAGSAPSIASVLSHSVSSLPQQIPNPTSSRPFNRAISGPAVTPGGYRASLLVAGERPLVRARRVPVEEKRKQDAEMERHEREEAEREREAKKVRMK